MILAQRGAVTVKDKGDSFGVSRGDYAVKYHLDSGMWTAFRRADGKWSETETGRGIFAASRVLGLEMGQVTEAITDAG